MFLVILSCCLLIAATTILHYEVLRAMNGRLGRMRVSERSKLLVVIMGALAAHFVEMTIYGLAFMRWCVFAMSALSAPHGVFR